MDKIHLDKKKLYSIFSIFFILGSLDFYNRALAVLGASPKGDESEKKGAVLCLNLAAAHLAMEHFEEAGEAAKKALEEGADKGKSFFRFVNFNNGENINLF
jgi:hypothetical protein